MREPTEFELHNERLFSKIEDEIRYALRRLEAFDDMGNHLGAEAWKDTSLDDLVRAVGIHLRAGLPNIFGDIIIAETIAFTERNWS